MFGKLKSLFIEEEDGDAPKGASTPSGLDDETAALLASLGNTPSKPAATPSGSVTAPRTAPAPTANGEWVEGRSFDIIYKEAGVPDSVYPVERFLKVADGLKAMGPAMARQALSAMDAGDDSWSVKDVRADQTAKLGVLATLSAELDGKVAAASAQRDAVVQAAETSLLDATGLIKEQIEELEAQLAAFAQEAAADKAAAEAALQETSSKVAREKARLLNESGRLAEASQYFD